MQPELPLAGETGTEGDTDAEGDTVGSSLNRLLLLEEVDEARELVTLLGVC